MYRDTTHSYRAFHARRAEDIASLRPHKKGSLLLRSVGGWLVALGARLIASPPERTAIESGVRAWS